MSAGQALTLAVLLGIQFSSFVLAWFACRSGGLAAWGRSVALGLLLVVGNGLFFFTPVVGAPFLIAAAIAAGALVISGHGGRARHLGP
jgi:hypothetical protein